MHVKENWFPLLLVIIITIVIAAGYRSVHQEKTEADKQFAAFVKAHPEDSCWRGWNKYQIPRDSVNGDLIWYGEQLIENTAYYLGPKGKVAQVTNGMNCQNCHLNGGTVPFGNNYGKVYSTYPKYRARNNGIQTIYERINDCFERSLNGRMLDTNSREMKAIYAYIKWLGDDVPKGVEREGTSLMKLPYLNRAADPVAGEQVYLSNCSSCHGRDGQGQLNVEQIAYTYPPLWGNNSYNDGAGLYRLSSFAGFVKNNMPFGADYHSAKLTNEEAWDVAAFVNSRERPHKDQRADWFDISKKPVDFPFGPYADSFTEKQHKYGPYQPIKIITDQKVKQSK